MRNFNQTIAVIILITNGLLAGNASSDMVVNVDARLNGPPDVSQSSGEVMQFLAAGDYTFTLVNNVIGHSSYHMQANFTGWSYHASGPGSETTWGTNYSFAYDDNFFGNDTLNSPPYVGPDRGAGGNFTQSDNALEAFNATTLAGLNRQVHIPFDQTVGFYFSDNVLSDNGGGVSILIRSVTVPEPSAVALLGAFGIGLTFLRQRRIRI